MGILETKSRKRQRRADIQNIVLGTVATAGMMSVALLAPNALATLQSLGLTPKSRQKESVKRAQANLIKRGLLKSENGRLHLTNKGQVIWQRLSFERDLRPKPRRWDHKWRVLIFDIPESKRRLRDRVRYSLRSAGFKKIQDSVWLYPYNCEDFVALLKADFRVGRDVLYLIVDTLEGDGGFQRLFGLK